MEWNYPAARDTERLVWEAAVAAYGADLPAILSDLLDRYTRSPGMDAVARVTPECLSTQGYAALLMALKASERRDVRFFDQGWHIEIRSRLRRYVHRGLQRQLVANVIASELLVEDLLAHDLGV